jgi:hypothetical protein
VEGLIPSKTEKETAQRAGAGNVEALAMWDSFAPLLEREKKTLDEDDEPRLTKP